MCTYSSVMDDDTFARSSLYFIFNNNGDRDKKYDKLDSSPVFFADSSCLS